MKLYLAYGSNLNKAQMAIRCPDAVPVGVSEILDHKLVFRRGFLTIEPDPNYSVPVGVWKISDADEEHLDLYEGFPRFYRKEHMLYRIPKDHGIDDLGEWSIDGWQDALVYIMNDGYPIQAPSNGYYTTVRQGYIDFDFKHEDFDRLWHAKEYATRNGVRS